MIFSERKQIIINELKKTGVINLKQIAKKIGSSEITTRRDFERLEKEGILVRVSGGAVLQTKGDFSTAELSINQKKIQNIQEKKEVALYASSFVKENECIFIDCGTCMIPLIQELSNKKITIVTNNMIILPYIENTTASIYVIGGKYNNTFEMNTGTIACNYIANYHFHHCFLGCGGIDINSNEIYTSSIEGLDIKKVAMKQSDTKILLLDSSKLSKHSLISFATLNDMDFIICNKPKEEVPLTNFSNLIYI